MIKGVKFEFANGETMVIPPLSLGALEAIEAEYGEMSTWGELSANSKFIISLAGNALRRNYPDLTDDKLKNELLDVGNMQDVMQAVMDIGGLKRKEQEEREAPKGETMAGSV